MTEAIERLRALAATLAKDASDADKAILHLVTDALAEATHWHQEAKALKADADILPAMRVRLASLEKENAENKGEVAKVRRGKADKADKLEKERG